MFWAGHTVAVMLVAFPSSPIFLPWLVWSRSCVTCSCLGCVSPWHTKLQCLDNVAVFLLGVSSMVYSTLYHEAVVLRL